MYVCMYAYIDIYKMFEGVVIALRRLGRNSRGESWQNRYRVFCVPMLLLAIKIGTRVLIAAESAGILFSKEMFNRRTDYLKFRRYKTETSKPMGFIKRMINILI